MIVLKTHVLLSVCIETSVLVLDQQVLVLVLQPSSLDFGRSYFGNRPPRFRPGILDSFSNIARQGICPQFGFYLWSKWPDFHEKKRCIHLYFDKEVLVTFWKYSGSGPDLHLMAVAEVWTY